MNLNLTLIGQPRTKKNHSRIVTKPFPRLLPSKAYERYEKDCLRQITGLHRKKLNGKYNIQCIYYMKTRHKVDLTNLLNATMDILVAAEVIEDDNSKIVAGHDGSRVLHDKHNPRVEITIMELPEDKQMEIRA